MNVRFPRPLAWFTAAVYFALSGAGLILLVLNRRSIEGFEFASSAALTLTLGFSTVIAARIAARRSHNPIGWILLALSLFWGMELFAGEYVSYGQIDQSFSLPGAEILLLWEVTRFSRFALVLLTLLFLWFPYGRPVSSRWGRLAGLAAVSAAIFVVLATVRPGVISGHSELSNPYGIGDAAWSSVVPIWDAANVVSILCVLAAAATLLIRLRQSTGDERQQVKWFLYGAAFFPLALIFLEFGGPGLQPIGLMFQVLSISGMVLAVAVSIFRYRLYDIDLIINRTLVYGLLSGVLGLVYFIGVTLLQLLFRQVSGQGSQVAVVISTLGIAALFNPLRRRIQEAIDRRFYRRRYDAEQALESIAAMAREEVDLDRLCGAIMGVVDETMHPEQVSLWMEADDLV